MASIKNFFSKLFGKTEAAGPDESFQKIWDDAGVFEYEEDGFKITDEDFYIHIKWNEIDKIAAYKKDLFAVDLIVMEISHNEKHLTLNEEMPGWFQFVLKTKEIFSEIPKDWDVEIMHPAFEENYTVLYSKTN